MDRAELEQQCSVSIRRQLFWGGSWQEPLSLGRIPVENPATGSSLGDVAEAGKPDVDRAVQAARKAFDAWRDFVPRERSDLLRLCARRLRENGSDLALIDAADAGLPRKAMGADIENAARQLEFFAGLVTEIKGETLPLGPSSLNYTVREPLGVVVRINAFNHPVMFAAGKVAAPLAAGNTVIIKPADQTPLSALALAEIWADIFPPGVFNVLTGSRETGSMLVSHPDVAKVGLIGNVLTGEKVFRASADSMKKLTLELGGKNALIACPDADPDSVADAAVLGMNLTWTAGQSCGSTSRVFLHDSIYDEVLEKLVSRIGGIKLGLPTDKQTEMGCLISREQYEKVLGYIEKGRDDGARVVQGGSRPDEAALADGYFIKPTVFADVTSDMRIAREEIFGPVVSVMRWSDEADMLRDVNDLDYGLTASIWTNDLSRAHRLAARVQSGYIWVNSVGAHFLGAPFGGYKKSGLGREESLEELFLNTQIKNVNIAMR
ncbi:MAG: betaine-aldehyde dehydrogenase [Rhodobacteraceae bacterium HLUCCA12]|nr:MAG: betaine-aldehyde dehydrogenase [Rhodobacteraceae bacterium HLUCCA12]